MRLSVVCEQCGGLELGACDHGDPRVLEALLVACHASGHSSPHQLTVRIDGKAPPEGEHEFKIRCLLPECGSPVKEVVKRTPMALVGALTISFHTHHEGHPVRVELDGAVIAGG